MTATASRVPTRLSPDQLSFFEREGYLSVEALTTQEEVAWLREVYDRLFARQAGREEGNQFDLAGIDEEGKQAALPQILQPAKYAPELNDSQLLKNVAEIGRQLLGPKAVASFGHAIYKPARHGAPTPWHQDAAYWEPSFHHHSISVWVPLQVATPENGCMYFVPRSHERAPDVLTHRSINNDPRIHGLELVPELMDHVKDAVACPLPPGGGTFHGGYTLHFTPPNHSDIPRRALILGVGIPSVRLPRERRFPWLDAKKTARMQREATAAKT